MERVKSAGNWTLMCPNQCPGLSDVYGDEFDALYEKYESEGKGKIVKAQDLWFKILDSQIETGTPYMLYKDSCNKKSNQKNIGTIKSSNLCTEIIEYSDENETAVCNLASIGLSKFSMKPKSVFNTITIYSKSDCDYCKLAKSHLKDFEPTVKETFNEINVDDDDLRHKIYKEIGEKFNKEINSVPQILVDGKYIGGYQELLEFMPYKVDHGKLHQVTKMVTENLNKVIDINFYPTEKTKRSNLRHRPVGIGVQGLADLFAIMKIPFHSEKAIQINKDIFETIYHAALEKSNELASARIKNMTLIKKVVNEIGIEHFIDDDKPHELIKQISNSNILDLDTLNKFNDIIEQDYPIKDELDRLEGGIIGSYSTFKGSPASQGILQFDMWGVTPSDKYDWKLLKEKIKKTGLRNSLLVAPMPTASTSQILGNNECFEPFTSNIYVRRTIAGEFVLANKYLMTELTSLGLWTEEVKNQIITDRGSIQKIKNIPKILKERFKIVWEIPMKHILNMAKDRAAFIDQSQSTNLWMENPTYNKLTAMHFYAWKSGLKTGLYYLRTKAKATPQQFTIDPTLKTEASEDDEGVCESCSG
jgi:ribonucleotide reductase alpha subunit